MLEQPLKTVEAWTDHFARQRIPVLRRTGVRLTELRADEARLDAAQIAGEVLSDPLLTLRLFAHVARLRARREHAEVGTVTRAIVLAGVPPFFAAMQGVPRAEDLLGRTPGSLLGLLRVIGRAQRAAQFAGVLAGWRNDLNAEEIIIAAQLHDFAEMLLWCFAAPLAARMRAMQDADARVRSVTAQRIVLGIELLDLQQALALRWHLPELLVHMMDDRHAHSPAVKNVLLAVNLARHSESGWDNAALPDDYREIAVLLSTTPDKVKDLVQPKEEDALERAGA